MILEMTRPVQGGLRQERKLEAVSNNLANADSNGFKKDRVSFDARFKAQMNKDFTQGALVTTGNPLDFALSGQGFSPSHSASQSPTLHSCVRLITPSTHMSSSSSQYDSKPGKKSHVNGLLSGSHMQVLIGSMLLAVQSIGAPAQQPYHGLQVSGPLQ